MSEKKFIQVILPLKLSWEPWYSVPSEFEGYDSLQVGSRVSVRCARRIYVGVVSSIGGNPDIAESKIQAIISIEHRLERILDSEIYLWRFIADYYLCTVGEVYKAAYPALRVASESKKPHKILENEPSIIKHHLSDEEKKTLVGILESFDDNKTVLLQGMNRDNIYNELIRRTLEEGRDVLVISPGASRMNPTEQREVSRRLRSSTKPLLVRSSRTGIFLPFRNLGLIVVDEEQDIALKQDAPAPHYNARDVAAVIARQQNAKLLLGSSTPSLESLYNVYSHKFSHIVISEPQKPVTLIDTDAEQRKNGMLGELSKKLLCEKEAVETQGKKAFIINSWELGNISKLKLDKYALVAVLHFEALLSRPDFRADEKAFQTLSKLRASVKGNLIIQTRNASHPVFSGDMTHLLSERKAFDLPPFTRQIVAKNSSGEIISQIFLPKDKNLRESKIKFAAESPKNAVIDVDPY